MPRGSLHLQAVRVPRRSRDVLSLPQQLLQLRGPLPERSSQSQAGRSLRLEAKCSRGDMPCRLRSREAGACTTLSRDRNDGDLGGPACKSHMQSTWRGPGQGRGKGTVGARRGTHTQGHGHAGPRLGGRTGRGWVWGFPPVGRPRLRLRPAGPEAGGGTDAGPPFQSVRSALWAAAFRAFLTLKARPPVQACSLAFPPGPGQRPGAPPPASPSGRWCPVWFPSVSLTRGPSFGSKPSGSDRLTEFSASSRPSGRWRHPSSGRRFRAR